MDFTSWLLLSLCQKVSCGISKEKEKRKEKKRKQERKKERKKERSGSYY